MIEIHNIKIIEIIFTIIVCLVAPQSPAAEFAGGTGEPNDPYQIATAQQLISIASLPNLLNKHYVLVNNIDLDPNLPGGQVFTDCLIANISSYDFSGSFDGNGHKIINLTIHINTDGPIYGLFGRVSSEGRVYNLGLEDIYISGGDLHFTGGLVGLNRGVIDNCYTTGNITCSGGTDIGGLVGHMGDSATWILIEDTKGNITNCYSTVNITCGDDTAFIGGLLGGNSRGAIVNCYTKASITIGDYSSVIGGLVGENWRGIITRCYTNGTVYCGNESDNIGGLVGNAWGESRIVNCYSATSVSTGDNSSKLGGFAGENNETIANCYSIGTVSCGENCRNVGGLVGDGSAYNSFWDTETSGVSNSDGGKGLTTTQMQDIQTYLDAGWDFIEERSNGTSDIWRMPESGGYPELAVFSEDYQPRILAGSGTKEDPFQIGTADDLGVMCYYNKFAYYKLVTDIDLSGITWSLAPIDLFNGSFNGDNHRIISLTIDSRGPDFTGLFGRIGSDTKIWNLGLENVFITGSDESSNLGGLAGKNSGDITNCYVTGSFSLGNECKETGILVGSNSGHITSSYSTGSISVGESSYEIGGLTGYNDSYISNSYAATNISAGDNSQYIGGLIGYQTSYFVTNCYATGGISTGDNSQDVGGLFGYGYETNNSFWDIQNSGISVSAGGIGLSTTQMQDIQTYLDARWDMVGERKNGTVDIWLIPEGGGYPELAVFSEGYQPHILAGSGTAEDPYKIATAEDLGAINHYSLSNPLACYELVADIDLSDIEWATAPITHFNGSFNGSFFILSGLTIKGEIYLGLFGTLDREAVVENVGLEDVNIINEGKPTAQGALAGSNLGYVTNCYANGSIYDEQWYNAIGGLIGYNRGTISSCYSGCNVFGDSYVGGLVGSNKGIIINCYANGTVSYFLDSPRFSIWCGGGLVGLHSYYSGTITNCYSTAIVSKSEGEKISRLVGDGNEDTITGCYFLYLPDSDNLVSPYGLPLMNRQMKQQASFVGWDFDNVWMICEGLDYPRLQFQETQCGE